MIGANRVEVIENKKVVDKREYSESILDTELSAGGKYLKVMLRKDKTTHYLVLLRVDTGQLEQVA